MFSIARDCYIDVNISNLPQRIKEVFDLTGFTSLFEIYPDTTEAVGSF